MADPSEVVLRYNTEKWLESTATPDPESPARYVTFNYQSQENSRTTSPTKESQIVQPGTAAFAGKPSTEYFVRPVSDSLLNLANYSNELQSTKIGKTDTNTMDMVDQNWYYDLTNVAQRLRLLRETFKVLQLVRKKRLMGARADFKVAQGVRSSQTGSPLILDDDNSMNSKTDDDDDTTVPEAPPPPPKNRRGRPRKKVTRGRKPGYRKETADAPVRTRASRRIQYSTLLPLLRQPTQGNETATDSETTANVELTASPPEESLHYLILGLPPPILPSQRFPAGTPGYSMPIPPNIYGGGILGGYAPIVAQGPHMVGSMHMAQSMRPIQQIPMQQSTQGQHQQVSHAPVTSKAPHEYKNTHIHPAADSLHTSVPTGRYSANMPTLPSRTVQQQGNMIQSNMRHMEGTTQVIKENMLLQEKPNPLQTNVAKPQVETSTNPKTSTAFDPTIKQNQLIAEYLQKPTDVSDQGLFPTAPYISAPVPATTVTSAAPYTSTTLQGLQGLSPLQVPLSGVAATHKLPSAETMESHIDRNPPTHLESQRFPARQQLVTTPVLSSNTTTLHTQTSRTNLLYSGSLSDPYSNPYSGSGLSKTGNTNSPQIQSSAMPASRKSSVSRISNTSRHSSMSLQSTPMPGTLLSTVTNTTVSSIPSVPQLDRVPGISDKPEYMGESRPNPGDPMRPAPQSTGPGIRLPPIQWGASYPHVGTDTNPTVPKKESDSN